MKRRAEGESQNIEITENKQELQGFTMPFHLNFLDVFFCSSAGVKHRVHNTMFFGGSYCARCPDDHMVQIGPSKDQQAIEFTDNRLVS